MSSQFTYSFSLHIYTHFFYLHPPSQDTLTHQVSKFLRKMSPYTKVLQGIKLVAKFFHTSETTETTEDYWDELAGIGYMLYVQLLTHGTDTLGKRQYGP